MPGACLGGRIAAKNELTYTPLCSFVLSHIRSPHRERRQAVRFPPSDASVLSVPALFAHGEPSPQTVSALRVPGHLHRIPLGEETDATPVARKGPARRCGGAAPSTGLLVRTHPKGRQHSRLPLRRGQEERSNPYPPAQPFHRGGPKTHLQIQIRHALSRDRPSTQSAAWRRPKIDGRSRSEPSPPYYLSFGSINRARSMRSWSMP